MGFSPTETLHTLDLFGFYLPPLLGWAVAAAVPYALLRWGLTRLGFYHYVWHRALFDMALYVVILGGMVLTGGGGWS